jgi:hypothetical protein
MSLQLLDNRSKISYVLFLKVMQEGCLKLWQTETVMKILHVTCVELNVSKHLFDPILKAAVYLTSLN